MSQSEALELIDGSEVSLLETVDHLLNQGVVLTGEVILGLAGIDLIYLRLSVLLCAADRILPKEKRESDG
jgi:gas vesicle protein GvpA/GvpJ/GvpM family